VRDCTAAGSKKHAISWYRKAEEQGSEYAQIISQVLFEGGGGELNELVEAGALQT
jgi:TPR repeat protein